MTGIDTAPRATPLYELSDIKRHFNVSGGVVKAVDGVSLSVSKGEFIALVGPSGSGKSTMLQLLGCLDRPTDGVISLNGKELSKLSDKGLTNVRASDIGFVFQQFNLIPTLSAADNIEAAMVTSSVAKDVRKKRALDLLAKVGLAERSTHLPSLLSGGEQQRVAIARALANSPSVILADEPTGNLDSITAQEIVNILSDLCSNEDVTVIVVTHDANIAEKAQRRLKMRDGKIEESNN